MISFYDVIRVPLEDVASTDGVLVDDARVGRGSVGGDLHRSGAHLSARVHNARAAAPSRPIETRTSMTRPC